MYNPAHFRVQIAVPYMFLVCRKYEEEYFSYYQQKNYSQIISFISFLASSIDLL